MTATDSSESADRIYADTVCQNCLKPLRTEYIRLGTAARCCHCGTLTVPRVPEGGHYPLSKNHVTFADFRGLARSAASAGTDDEVGRLIRDWFGYAIVADGEDLFACNSSGERIDLLWLHLRIQADEQMRPAFYNTAMTIWHS